ncbi:flagellar transcriptional regulator FlhD [Pelomicrobium sp.]|jgi:flagellar transcriptional activator FlhD|uniref:flagellar transcriptional regulator FlhD n=1 Tax=Pelomicrobium sp. TaxID=2815319 RepID=UPI002FDD545E
MDKDRLMEEIRELNLAYLLLAQQMVRQDRGAALYRLGIGEEMADILAALTPGQISKMAGSNLLLCRFRFDDGLILDMLSSYTRDRLLGASHATILLSGQPVPAAAA